LRGVATAVCDLDSVKASRVWARLVGREVDYWWKTTSLNDVWLVVENAGSEKMGTRKAINTHIQMY
jgi:hypothetical protein